MQNKKALLHMHFSTRERLCECIGIYRHVVVNIVLFFAHACTVYASTKDQSNGTQRINIQGQNVRTKDHLWTQCMYKKTIL